jgi:aconitase B
MTRDELKDLASLGLSSALVMQSFYNAAAYGVLSIRVGSVSSNRFHAAAAGNHDSDWER